MNVNFINPFLQSLLNVISTMASMDLTPGKPQIKSDNLAKGMCLASLGSLAPKQKDHYRLPSNKSWFCR